MQESLPQAGLWGTLPKREAREGQGGEAVRCRGSSCHAKKFGAIIQAMQSLWAIIKRKEIKVHKLLSFYFYTGEQEAWAWLVVEKVGGPDKLQKGWI